MKPWNKTRESFASSPSPRFDAFEAVRSWIGDCQFPDVIEHLRLQGGCTICFQASTDHYLLGEFGAEVLYDHIWGEGKWQARAQLDIEKHTAVAFAAGQEAGRQANERMEEDKVLLYEGPMRFQEAFVAGLQSVIDTEKFKLAAYDLTAGGERVQIPEMPTTTRQ